VPELEAAAKARPDDPDVLVALGVAQRGLGKPEDARRAYEGALAVAPEFPAAHFNLGVLFMDFLPDKKKAREHFQVYRKVAPSADARQKEAESRLKELR
jgi:Flp pilus assembly protein TadD